MTRNLLKVSKVMKVTLKILLIKVSISFNQTNVINKFRLTNITKKI